MPEVSPPVPELPDPAEWDSIDPLAAVDEYDMVTGSISPANLAQLEVDLGDSSPDTLPGRLQADRQIVAMLALEDFSGPLTMRVCSELATGTYPVIKSWLHHGKIFEICASKKIPVQRSKTDVRPWSEHDRTDVAGMTVMNGRNLFWERGLRRGEWDPSLGASLATYFTGACLLCFRSVYYPWWRKRVMKQSAELQIIDDPDFVVTPSRLVERTFGEDPADVVARRDEVRRALADLPDERLRHVVALQGVGYTRSAAAREVGITEKAAERAIDRYRKKKEQPEKTIARPEAPPNDARSETPPGDAQSATAPDLEDQQ